MHSAAGTLIEIDGEEWISIEQGQRHDALNAKGNFRFERIVAGWRAGSVVDSRRKR